MAGQRDPSVSISGGTIGTFINNPQAAISDFENTFIRGDRSESDSINEQLRNLLELISDSKDMPNNEKEDIVQAIKNMAASVKEGKAKENKLTIQGTLEKVKELASKAADIAGPAVSIITAVMRMFG